MLFTQFLERSYPQLNTDEQLAFQALLEVQDPTIMDWLFGKLEPDTEGLKVIVHKLQLLSGV